MKPYWSLIGYGLILVGFLSIIVNLVGLEFSWLLFLDRLGSLGAFLVKLACIMAGFILIYLQKTNWKELN